MFPGPLLRPSSPLAPRSSPLAPDAYFLLLDQVRAEGACLTFPLTELLSGGHSEPFLSTGLPRGPGVTSTRTRGWRCTRGVLPRAKHMSEPQEAQRGSEQTDERVAAASLTCFLE